MVSSRFSHRSCFQIEQFSQNANGVFWPIDGVTGGARILVNLIIIASLERFIAKEMYRLVVDTRQILALVRLGFNMFQTIGFVPTMREDVEGDHTTNGITTDIVSKDWGD